jgi:SAM-dependent methyltransferase
MISRRHARLAALAREIYSNRDDLRAAFSSVESPEFWFWLMWHGPLEYPEVATLIECIPPPALRDRVAGARVTETDFHRGGLVDWRRLERSLRIAGHDFTAPGTILDFGCGCARTLRFFGLYAGTTTFHGADVDWQALDWSRRHIDFPCFTQITPDPPSPYGPGQFDAVVSFSVFTHLSETNQLKWMGELARIVRPDGKAVISTHGRTALQHALEGKCDMPLSKEQLGLISDCLERDGTAFSPYTPVPAATSETPGFDPFKLPSYGTAFILETYVRSHWTRHFDVVQYLEAPDDWHDIVILKRRVS